jgi:hypothetical protein
MTKANSLSFYCGRFCDAWRFSPHAVECKSIVLIGLEAVTLFCHWSTPLRRTFPRFTNTHRRCTGATSASLHDYMTQSRARLTCDQTVQLYSHRHARNARPVSLQNGFVQLDSAHEAQCCWCPHATPSSTEANKAPFGSA